ncbi:hypothetical protein FACS1894217_05210 [Clostridia bacterium]|nr:hypothetical protein FACS1894217_05210 [Clostridia bacterium]
MEMKDIIKANRIRLGLSQRELGEKVGVNKAAVQKWECGKVINLKREILVSLSNIFEITMDELYTAEKSSFISRMDKRTDHDKLGVLSQLESNKLYNMHNLQGGGAEIFMQLAQNITSEQVQEAIGGLNQDGLNKVMERIQELMRLPEYTAKGSR